VTDPWYVSRRLARCGIVFLGPFVLLFTVAVSAGRHFARASRYIWSDAKIELNDMRLTWQYGFNKRTKFWKR
jgi:hypothetical protein